MGDNSAINDSVLQAAHEAGVQHLLGALSTCIFPDKTTYPIDETMGYNEQYGRNYTTFVPTNIFGPFDNYGEGSHVLPALMNRAYQCKASGDDFVIWGSGSPLRQFIYNKDLGKLILWVLRNYQDPEPIILSVGEDEEISIKDAALSILEAIGFEGEVVFDTTKQDGQFRKPATNAKLLALYPEFEFTPFKQAIQESVDWFVANYETART